MQFTSIRNTRWLLLVKGDTLGEALEGYMDRQDLGSQVLEYGAYDGANPMLASLSPRVTPRWLYPRQQEWNENRQVLKWERPAQVKIKEGTGVGICKWTCTQHV